MLQNIGILVCVYRSKEAQSVMYILKWFYCKHIACTVLSHVNSLAIRITQPPYCIDFPPCLFFPSCSFLSSLSSVSLFFYIYFSFPLLSLTMVFLKAKKESVCTGVSESSPPKWCHQKVNQTMNQHCYQQLNKTWSRCLDDNISICLGFALIY